MNFEIKAVTVTRRGKKCIIKNNIKFSEKKVQTISCYTDVDITQIIEFIGHHNHEVYSKEQIKMEIVWPTVKTKAEEEKSFAPARIIETVVKTIEINNNTDPQKKKNVFIY